MKIPVKSQYFHAKPVLLSGAKRSEKDAYSRGAIRARRNSGETQFGKRNSAGSTRCLES
jgi:hypothetical protein